MTLPGVIPTPALIRGKARPNLRGFAWVTLGTLALLNHPLAASERDWANTGTDFNAPASWTTGVAPVAGDVAGFTAAKVTQSNLSASKSIAGLFFKGAASAGYDLTATNGAVLTLTGYNTTGSSGTSNSSAVAIRSDIISLTNTVDASLLLAPGSGATSVFYQAGGGTLVINGPVSGSTTILSLKGAGTVQLNAANSFISSSVDQAGETVVLGNNGALGSGTLSINNTATLQAGGGARSIANVVVLAADTTISGSNNLDLTASVTGSGSSSRSLTVSSTGTTTISGSVFLAPDNTTARGLIIGGTTAVGISGVIANNNSGNTLASAFAYNGTSTLTLTNANTFTGTTGISNGTLSAAVANALSGTSRITVNNGGTLLLAGTGDRIGNAVPVTLNGGTFNTGGLSEGSAGAVGVGALTLSANSSIDLGAGNASLLHFADSNVPAWTTGLTLSILGYSGAVKLQDGTFGGTAGDALFFGNAVGGLTTAQVAEIAFVNPSGYTGTFGAFIDSNGEVFAAVPEPGTTVAGLLALGALGWDRCRRRRAAGVRRWQLLFPVA